MAGLSLIMLFLGASSIAQAEVIVSLDSTTDTDQGLEFLHVGNTPPMSAAGALSGFEFGGKTWQLATVEQFLTLVENAAGVTIPDWDGSNLGDYDMSGAEAIEMMIALDGPGTSVLPGFWLLSATYGPSQAYAHTGNDDFHLQQGANWGGEVPALFVSAGAVESVPVPTLSQWALIMLGLLMLAITGLRLRKQS